MNDLRDLYQEVIFDHYKKPRNCHVLDCANHQAEGYNPLCGDQITVYLKVDNGVIKDLSFEGSGCAISTASASLMTEALKGKKIAEVEHLFDDFHQMVTASEGYAASATGQTRSTGRRARISGPREVRDAGLAHAASRAERSDQTRFYRVKKWIPK